MQPAREQAGAQESPAPQPGEPGTAPAGGLQDARESPQLCPQEAPGPPGASPSSTRQSSSQDRGDSGGDPESTPSLAWESPSHYLPDAPTPPLQPWNSACQIPSQQLGAPGGAPARAPRGSWECSRLQPLLAEKCPKDLGKDWCCRDHRRVLPRPAASRDHQIAPPRSSRVNGWSKPFEKHQAVSWAICVILAIAMFGIFIPMLPGIWRNITYAVTGGIFLLQIISYLLCVSIDPAEDNVRRKIYGEILPTFDGSKQHHVIEDLYCCLCGVTVSETAKHCRSCNKCVVGFDHHCKWLNNCIGSRNYWCFFTCVGTTSAWLLCTLVILIYVPIQHQVNPELLRTDPQYQNIGSQNTWLLFLPYFHLKAKTPVVVIIGVLVLLLDIVSLLMVGQLLMFHLYLISKGISTYNYLNPSRKRGLGASSRNRIPSFHIQISPEV